MENLDNTLLQLNEKLILYKSEIDILKVEFDNENFEKGKLLIEVINILYQNLNCLNLSENDEPFKIVASLICDQILIEQLEKATNELQKQCKVLDVVKIRNTAFQAFDFQTLNILYRQLFDYLTKNELVLHEYEKYPKKLINSTKKEILKLMKVNEKNQIEGSESEEKIYLYKDGKKQMSEYEFFKQIGSFENLEKFGMTLNPVHDFNLLKPKRQTDFDKFKSSFLDERKLNNLETNNFDLNAFYLAWLKSELNTIENWLSNVCPNGKPKRSPSVSDQIEIGKYKNFVFQEIEKIEKAENNNSEHKSIDNRTKKLICEIFTNIDSKGWNYAFETELDFNLFTDLLARFFEYEPFELPKTIIKLKRNCKTKVAKALGEIHKELSNQNKLINDNEYFKIIRVLSPFETTIKTDLYKALTR